MNYQQETQENEKQFEAVLESLSPEFYYIYKSIKDNKINPSEIMEIVYKIGLCKGLDEGYGKIFIDIQNRSIQRIKFSQEKIIKPMKAEIDEA